MGTQTTRLLVVLLFTRRDSWENGEKMTGEVGFLTANEDLERMTPENLQGRSFFRWSGAPRICYSNSNKLRVEMSGMKGKVKS